MASALLVSPFFEKKKLLLSCIGGSLLIALIVLPNRSVVEEILTVSEKAEDVSLSSRVSVWRSTVAMTLDRPFFGTGPGTYTIVFTQYQPPGMIGRYTIAHSDYLHFIAETGMALMAIVIWMIVVFFRKGFSKLKNPSRFVRGTTLGAMSGLTAMLVHSIFDFNLHIPANALLFTVLAAIVVSPIPKYDERHWLQNHTLTDPYKPHK